MAETRIIRKYANRRLYDTETSKHINQADVRKLIAAGTDVRVVDDASGEDITRGVLLQLVAEQERGGRPVLSDQMLTQIIRFYEHPMQGMFGAYLQQSFEAFLQQQQGLEEKMQGMLEGGPFAALTEMAAQNMEAWVSMQKAFTNSKSGKDDD
ncbi:MAG: polyhydroxyalkanoate synthesis repressor PhaR [Woeseiaceae bacterium]|nr:polyhydroxyalkanoate synthesis repressor PhaR [Woeseiaceae bacterium]